MMETIHTNNNEHYNSIDEIQSATENKNIKKNDNKITKKNKKHDECVELKNINYKNMLLKGSNLSNNEEKYDNNILDKFLEEESEMSKKEHWLKLDKPDKLIKLKNYGNILIDKYKLNDKEILSMNNFFNSCIDLKKINKIKDIEYDKENGTILNIPIILFNENNRSFYIKKCEKHVSTVKSIPPKKNRTVKTN
uniref:Uncharacterized protein n=1 Tax=Nucleocytoviricota sp. TaxID=2809609 RepID=A0A9E8G6Q5_9VIRU|nr:hypothetical protein [Nucleocytoviricota sp.]UZT29187.1 hypothetical protein [Nucleocytoviricota sp.]